MRMLGATIKKKMNKSNISPRRDCTRMPVHVVLQAGLTSTVTLPTDYRQAYEIPSRTVLTCSSWRLPRLNDSRTVAKCDLFSSRSPG